MKNYVDEIFIKNCKEIINNGASTEGQIVRPKWSDGAPAHTKGIFGVINKYDISLGLPLMSLRPTNWKNAIDEILWIWQKKSNNIKDLGSKIWDSWADKDGSIGKAYGYQLGEMFNNYGKPIDQVDFVLNALRNHSVDRGIITNIFNHKDLDEMGLRPCVHSTQWSVREGKLDLMLIQRSQDTVVANNWNVVQYAALLMMFARDAGLECGILSHVIGDMHIYDRHIEIAEKMIELPSYPLAKTILNPKVINFYDFKVDDFIVVDYFHGENIKGIPVAV